MNKKNQSYWMTRWRHHRKRSNQVAEKHQQHQQEVEEVEVAAEEEAETFSTNPHQEFLVSTPPFGDATAVRVYNDNNSDNVAATTTRETVVLLHGCGGSMREWHEGKIAPRLATQFRVVAFDWYGHGASGDISGGCYTQQVYMQQLQAVLDKFCHPIHVPTFHLYAFSMGNYLALHYVRLHPHRIQRLVLHSPWNAELSAFGPPRRVMNCLVHVPLVGLPAVELVRRTMFVHVHTARIFRNIVTTVGQGPDAWEELVKDVAEIIRLQHQCNHTFPPPNDPCTTPKVLILCGQAERPFARLARQIHDQLLLLLPPNDNDDDDDKNDNTTAVATTNNLVTFVSFPHASHMTWHDKAHLPVGAWFRRTVFDFLTASSSSSTEE